MPTPLLPLDDVATVLFDLGGVLFPDPWETVVLTPGVGVADRLRLDRERAAAAGSALWPRFSRRAETEEAWWEAFEREVGVAIPRDLVARVSTSLLVPLPAGLGLLATARASGCRLGVITDNTAFWFPRQARALDLDAWAEPDLRYVSSERGVGKRDGLFEMAASEVDPRATLVVDDRDHNLERARACGFRTLRFPPAT